MTTEWHTKIFERLLDYYTPEQADRWMAENHPQLDGLSADFVISKEGVEGYRKVSAIIDRRDADAYI